MGDRYYLENIKCIYCETKQLEEIYYAPTSNFLTFKCEKCGKENFITADFKTKKIEDATYNDVYEAISMASNFMNEKQIKRCTKETFKKLKGGKQEAQQRFEKIIDKKIFGYESEEGTHDFISEAILRVLKELKSKLKEVES